MVMVEWHRGCCRHGLAMRRYESGRQASSVVVNHGVREMNGGDSHQ